LSLARQRPAARIYFNARRICDVPKALQRAAKRLPGVWSKSIL